MPDDKLTEFLVKLCANTNNLLDDYRANREGTVNAADLAQPARDAFLALPDDNALRAEIRNTQGGGPGGKKPSAGRKQAAAKKRKAPAKKAQKTRKAGKAKKAAKRGTRR